MGNFLYTIAVVLIILWLIGVLAYSLGGMIHLLLGIALFAVLLRIIRGNKPF